MTTSPTRLSQSRPRKRKNIEDSTNKFLAQATAALQSKTDDCDAYGIVTANKLRKMSEEQRQFFEPLLVQLLNKGVKGELNINTFIGEHPTTTMYHTPQHRATPSTSCPQQQQGTPPTTHHQQHQATPWSYPTSDRAVSSWGSDFHFTNL